MQQPDDNLEVTREELIPQLSGAGMTFLLLDVRERFELGSGILPGARIIPLSQLEQRWSDLPRDTRIVCYCEHGVRSFHVAAFLQQQGFQAVSLAGGFAAWTGPVETALPEAFE